MAVIRNIGRIALPVGIILKDGTKAFTRVMPRNKGVKLKDGAILDPHWMALHGKDIKVFNDEVLEKKATPVRQLKRGLVNAVAKQANAKPVQPESSTTQSAQQAPVTPEPSAPVVDTAPTENKKEG